MYVAMPAGKSAAPEGHVNNRLPTTMDQAVGKRIRSLRRAAGMTLRDLGEAVGVSGVQFQRYETGVSRVAASRLMAICDALGVQVDSVIAGASSAEMEQMSRARRIEFAELARAFNAISDPTHRRAIIALARAFAASHEHPGAADDQSIPNPATSLNEALSSEAK